MLARISPYRLFEYGIITITLSLILTTFLLVDDKIYPLIVALLPISLLFLYQGKRISGGLILFYILLSITFLENDEGIQPIELPFYAFSLILIFYNIIEALRGNILLNTFIDKLYLVITLLVPYGILFGLINGSSLYLAIGETTYLLGLFVYFPLRKYLSNKSFKRILYVIVLIIITYVLIRNLLNYRQILIQAVATWQTEKARVPSNEFVIMFGALLFMGGAIITKIRILQIIFTVVFIALIAGLVLTQSRGYWLAFFLGTITIFFVVDLGGKIRMTYTFLVLISFSIIIAQLFFYDQFYLILKGLAARFDSIGSGKLDISLYERFLESKAVLKEIIYQPISGYGMGVTYTKKFVFYNYFADTSYIHNGYLGTWFKLGLVGLIIFPLLWISLIIKSIRIFRHTDNLITKIVMLSIAGTISGVILVNNTSPQVFNFISCLFVTVFSAVISTINDEKNN